MKVLFEVLLNAEDLNKSRFIWLNNKNNWLFIIEDGKRMRTLSVDSNPGKELQSTTLTETRTCTSLSWNKDGSLLAMVVDKRQIYFWEIKSNNFTHYKPVNKLSNTNVPPGKPNKTREVELIEWSKLSNKLVICYSTGQLLLCNCDASLSERFIDSSEGVLKHVSWIESSAFADLFVCITVISEMLVMTFDGESKFYIQRDNLTIFGAKLSPVASTQVLRQNHKDDRFSEPQIEKNLWLAYQTTDGRLIFNRISLQNYSLSETSSRADITYTSNNIESRLVDFHWLSSAHLITCFASGTIDLLQIKSTNIINGQPKRFTLATEQILDLNLEEEMSSGVSSNQTFKSFELMCYDRSQTTNGSSINTIKSNHQQQTSSLSMAVISSYKLFYYEIVEVENQNKYAFEKVDDLNLTGSLIKLRLELERIKWCFDCSMLAVQLNNGHILVYRTRLQDHMVALHRSRTAYMSGANEITILNFGPQLGMNDHDHGDSKQQQPLDQKAGSQEESSSSGGSAINAGNALVINVELRPSIIDVGPKHLAVALNNRIQFYSVSLPTKAEESSSGLGGDGGRLLVDEQEYASIVVAVSMNSHFVAVLFDDGRLKLHAIQSNKLTIDDLDPNSAAVRCPVLQHQNLFDSDERFFPEPTEEEQISAFILTEDLLLYSTYQCNMNVFNLKDWAIVQTCQHSKHFSGPILRLRANERGNKFVCLLAPSTSSKEDDNVFLYDLYTNQMIGFIENDLFSRIFASQLIVHLPRIEPQLKLQKLIASTTATKSAVNATTATTRPRLHRIMDAIWDGDGKTVLLTEQKCIHIFINLDHTLEREDTLIWYVKTVNKASSYTLLYASQGIVSFQTALGRVINSILDSYDDEPRLMKLEQQIALLREQSAAAAAKPDETSRENEVVVAGSNELQVQHRTDPGLLEAQAEAMSLKLDYLRTIMPIYSLTKCKEICEHLMSEEAFNLVPEEQRKHGLMLCAHVLREVLEDARNKRLDAKGSIKTRLLVLLGCDI